MLTEVTRVVEGNIVVIVSIPPPNVAPIAGRGPMNNNDDNDNHNGRDPLLGKREVSCLTHETKYGWFLLDILHEAFSFVVFASGCVVCVHDDRRCREFGAEDRGLVVRATTGTNAPLRTTTTTPTIRNVPREVRDHMVFVMGGKKACVDQSLRL